MSAEQITFNDNNNFHIKSRVILGAPETPKMISFLTSKGIVKSERAAMILLLTLAGLFFISSIVVFVVFNTDLINNDASNFGIQVEINRHK